MNGSAVFSSCKRYRYVLRRIWDLSRPTVLFVGLNPSTADAKANDPTIRRCIRFANDWGYGAIVMANLFAYRATSPDLLPCIDDPVGPKNNWWLTRLEKQADIVIAAWGVHGSLRARNLEVLGKMSKIYCLGRTKAGHPKHPLYLSARVTPSLFCN
jgi:hypothetical protein